MRERQERRQRQLFGNERLESGVFRLPAGNVRHGHRHRPKTDSARHRRRRRPLCGANRSPSREKPVVFIGNRLPFILQAHAAAFPRFDHSASGDRESHFEFRAVRAEFPIGGRGLFGRSGLDGVDIRSIIGFEFAARASRRRSAICAESSAHGSPQYSESRRIEPRPRPWRLRCSISDFRVSSF